MSKPKPEFIVLPIAMQVNARIPGSFWVYGLQVEAEALLKAGWKHVSTYATEGEIPGNEAATPLAYANQPGVAQYWLLERSA